ncbi:MAG: tRNA (adenosine(37)-N6)-threonylcarbamoyltransferase complex dimerization subunit type 1 TsaB [Luteolibacter sp.]|uniref:tRNA (adenosine(37)-N6)-threonylcarbamoyltransferase complex dimerization subunit type 1 TsaB n=1 Tax=Luteolibacter sp. TaxID=1962973 RepID=UPI00326438E3
MTDTFTLVLETSTPQASLATIEPDGHLEHREFTSDRSHNAVLFGPLKELLDARQAPKIGLVLVGSGPGSYSGTRVGIAAAQGVAITSGCPAIALPSILAVPSAQNGASCLAIGDARRGSFWTAAICESRLMTEPELTDAEGLFGIVSAALTDGIPVFSFEDPNRFPLPPEILTQVRLEFPNAERLWQAWSAAAPETRELWSSASPQPMYLKPPHITPAKRPWLVLP